MPTPPACDIREIRPTEAEAALERIGGELDVSVLDRRLSVGAFDPGDGTLQGVALNETLSPRGCRVHLHCDDLALGRLLLDRALSKAAAAGHRASRVAVHPEAAGVALWERSNWPGRTDAATADGHDRGSAASPAAPEALAAAATPDVAPDADTTAAPDVAADTAPAAAQVA